AHTGGSHVWRNNYIHHMGKFTSAIFYWQATNSIWEGNRFENIMGIAIAWKEGTGSGDHTSNDDNIARNNTFWRMGYCWAPTNQNGESISNLGSGVRCPQGSPNPDGGGIVVSQGTRMQVYNNVFQEMGATAIWIENCCGSHKIYSNTNFANIS